MADFGKSREKTQKVEVGYGTAKGDLGGETFNGIARKFNPRWKGWAIIDAYNRQGVKPEVFSKDKALLAAAYEFDKREFWDSMHGDQIDSQLIAEEVFDFGYNAGQGTAGKILQRVINLFLVGKKISVDGKVGPGTVAALNSLCPAREIDILKSLNWLQGQYYVKSVERRQSQDAFINGWYNWRVDHVNTAPVDIDRLNPQEIALLQEVLNAFARGTQSDIQIDGKSGPKTRALLAAMVKLYGTSISKSFDCLCGSAFIELVEAGKLDVFEGGRFG